MFIFKKTIFATVNQALYYTVRRPEKQTESCEQNGFMNERQTTVYLRRKIKRRN